MVNKSMKKLFVGLAVLSTAANMSAAAVESTSKGFFAPRASSANIAREMLMQPNQLKHSDGWYGSFSATAFYQRGWNENSVDSTNGANSDVTGLGAFPLWSGTNTMSATNSTIGGLTTPIIDTYQLGLGTSTTAGSLALNPIVYQAGADFMFIVGSASHEPGFLFKIKAPIAVYNINPNLSEPVATVPAASYPAGALSLSTVAVPVTTTTLTQAFAGKSGAAQAQGTYVPMQYGLVNGDISTGAKFGDIEMTAGYNFISTEDNSFSLAVRASAPTGNKAEGVYMLEPIVGRGGNWGLGGYTAGHVNMWEGSNDNRLSFKFMAEAMHLFATDTVRSYDLLNNGQGSRYMLVGNFTNATTANGTASFGGTVQNLINLSTLASTSSFGVEGDVALGFNYSSRGWSFDLGYEFYGRSAETLVITGELAANTWGVLGHQGVGEVGGTGTDAALNVQPYATMSQSSAALSAPIANDTIVPVSTPTVVGSVVTGNLINGNDALNVEAAQQAAYLTSKIFTKIGYEWDNSDYVPFLGVMGEFEFSNCLNNALPQWSVALIGGVSF